MELSSLETSCDSILDEGVDSSGSTSLHPAREKRAASDTAFGPPIEEMSLQTSTKQPSPKREHLNSSEESSSKGDASMCLSFLKKLWDVVENDRFESIWWGDNGKCVVIHEELFEEEILARRGCLRIFESESMKSFTRHLQLYGFTRKLTDFPKSGSHSDLLAEEMDRELHFYYNPNFQRCFPHALLKYKESFGSKNLTPAGFSLDTRKKRSRKRKCEAELMWEATSEKENGPSTAGPREDVHSSAPGKAPPAKCAKAAPRVRWASAPACLTALTDPSPMAAGGWKQLHPLASSLLLQRSSSGPAGVLGAASAAASPGPAIPDGHLPPGLAPPTSLAAMAAAAALSLPRPPWGHLGVTSGPTPP